MPRARHQFPLGLGRSRRRLDQRDDLVDIGQRHREALEHMAPIARLSKFKDSPPGDDLAPMAQKRVEDLLEIEQPRLVFDQRHHIHSEGVLHLCFFVQIVQDDFGTSPRLSSSTTRIPDLSDSSRISDRPSSRFSRTRSPIFISSDDLLTW